MSNYPMAIEKAPAERIYTGENEVTVDDIQPGDVVRFVHEDDRDTNSPYKENYALVLDVRDEWFDTLRLDPGAFTRYAETHSLADRGLKPYERKDGSGYWNSVNHTQSTGINIPPAFHSREEAQEIIRVLNSVSELQERHGVEPPEPSLESLALNALLVFTIEGRNLSLYRHDVPSA